MRKLLIALFALLLILSGCENKVETPPEEEQVVEVIDQPANEWEFTDDYEYNVTLLKNNPPKYEGETMIRLDDSWFEDEYKTCTDHFETYSGFDDLGRVGVAFANIDVDYMPLSGELRTTDVSSIKPTGWKQKKYEGLVEDDYLYNRSHLIAYSLVDETSDIEEYKYRLFTGTRQLNLSMADLEFDVLMYVKQTKNHLLYRATPIFYKDELLARGLLVETYCVEGLGLSFDDTYYFFNVQDGVEIDYRTGESELLKD